MIGHYHVYIPEIFRKNAQKIALIIHFHFEICLDLVMYLYQGLYFVEHMSDSDYAIFKGLETAVNTSSRILLGYITTI